MGKNSINIEFQIIRKLGVPLLVLLENLLFVWVHQGGYWSLQTYGVGVGVIEFLV